LIAEDLPDRLPAALAEARGQSEAVAPAARPAPGAGHLAQVGFQGRFLSG
jgi:hypothetical protein